MKKLLSIALLTLSVGLWAETQKVSYRYPVYNTDGVATSGIKEWKTGSVTATVVESATEQVTWGTAGETTWLVVVKGTDVQLAKGAICQGAVHLILADGAKLTVTGESWQSGIKVSGDGNSLAIYGQSTGEQMGQLIANGGINAAGIGGVYGQAGSNITINGGIVMANGYTNAAGIGGGQEGDGLDIAINGGIVTATGGNYGAGIGGGNHGSGSNITINGGIVTATGGEYGAGIGGGNAYLVYQSPKGGNGRNITINGGAVEAIGGTEAAGIGNGRATETDASNIKVVTNLIVKADGNNPPTTTITNTGADIANNLAGKRYVRVGNVKDNLTAEDFVVSNNIHVCNGEAKAATVQLKEGIEGAGEIIVTYKHNGAEVTPVNAGVYDICAAVTESDKYKIFAATKVGELTILDPIPYIDENGKEQTAGTLIVNSATDQVTLGTAGQTTWYVVKGANITFPQGAVCIGDVRLILADGAKLTATGGDDQAGIQVSGEGNSLTIYGQVNQSGQLIANGGIKGAGIGGGKHQDGSNITINGGKVTATGGEEGAGIGGGTNNANGPGAKGSNITINGGTITANGGWCGAGIGGGDSGNGSNIIINGGTVTAKSEKFGAGIGGGSDGSGSNITINGGIVTAIGGECGAGIGGGIRGAGSNITIKGGQVTANSSIVSDEGFSIGDGIGNGSKCGASSNILVDTWCTVKADGNNPPKAEIKNNGGDLAGSLKGKQYATVETPKSDLTAADFVISNKNVTYNGEVQMVEISMADDSKFMPYGMNMTIYYNAAKTLKQPINVGTYPVYIDIKNDSRYNDVTGLTSEDWKLTIAKADPQVDLFTYTAPDGNTYYNGKPREAKVELNSQGKTGVGTITAIKYNGNTTVPSAAGEYTVSIDVAEGDNYNAATGLTDDAWKFTIKGWPTPEPSNPVAVEIVKDGKAIYSVSTPDKVKYYKSDSKVEIIQNSSVVYSAENPEGVRYTHSYVDLGLPSGMLWAAYNIGATKPEEYGEYYAWGDPRKKTEFFWNTYPYGESVNHCTKYHNDNKWTLEPEDDMATVNWGSRWRVPTKADFKELLEQCDTVFTTYKNVYGLMLISKTNGKTLFLPAAGNMDKTSLDHAGEGLYYWSSSVIDYGGNVFWLQNSASMSSWSGNRQLGFSVRPVYDPFVALTAADFKLSTPTATYDGEIKEAEVSMADTKKSMPDNITIYYNNDKSLQPKDAGTYQVYIDIVGDNHYNDVKGLTSEAWKFTIEKATPTADMFTYTAPSDLYDNVDSHEATVTFNNQNDKLTGMGTVIVKYNDNSEAPTDLGDYAVSIDVAEGTNYKAAEKLSDEAWKFTIKDFAPDGVEAVDLGLPSGLKWANVNVDVLDDKTSNGFFTWGEATNPDVATTNWGDNWRLPTKEEFQELIENCTWEWVDDNDYGWGYNVSSKTNGKSIFLPAYGYLVTKASVITGCGSYWSSSIDKDNTYHLYFTDESKSVNIQPSHYRCSVRPVLKSNGK